MLIILKLINSYIETINEIIKGSKTLINELTPKTGLTQEDVDNFYNPLHNNITTLNNQLIANESIETLKWDDTIFNDLKLPKHLRKNKKVCSQLKALIEQTRDFFQQICNACEGEVRNSIQKSKLCLIDNDESRQQLGQVAIKLGYFALGYNSYANNNGLKEFIDTYTKIELKDEENSAGNFLAERSEKEKVQINIMNSISTVGNVKEYDNSRKKVHNLLKSIDDKLIKEVSKFYDEKREK